MNWFKQSQGNPIDSMFENIDSDSYRVVSKDSPKKTSTTITLYRGMNIDLQTVKRSGGNIILSPEKSEQGVMWFTHNMIRGYNAKEYVAGRGNYVLEYPLQCIKHSQTIHYANGGSSETIPDEIMALTEPASNCKYHYGYELPDGWLFSYKSEKFIICTKPITVTQNMLHPDESFRAANEIQY